MYQLADFLIRSRSIAISANSASFKKFDPNLCHKLHLPPGEPKADVITSAIIFCPTNFSLSIQSPPGNAFLRDILMSS